MDTISNMYVGVDVSKNTLDIAFHPTKQHFKVSNDAIGIAEMIGKIQQHNVARIACESTGGYQREMVTLLRKANYQIEVLDPKLVKHFILSKKIKAKTDKIDAHMIALFTAYNEPEYQQPVVSEKHEQLRDMTRRRADFIEDISREKRRLKQTIHQKAKDFIRKHIEYIDEQIGLIDIELEQLIDSQEQWKNNMKILLSVPGIGVVASTTLLAEMPELGAIENKQAASLLGVAPCTKQSGTFSGVASIRGGRFVPRKALYMAALSASHGKSRFKDFYQRLKGKGKKAKVCIVALMNKMISIANTLIRKGEKWNPDFCV